MPSPTYFRLIDASENNRAYLVCYGPVSKTKIRGFLRELGIRPEARNFKHVLPPPWFRNVLSIYRLTGDAWLKVRARQLPPATWANLMLLTDGRCGIVKLLG